MNPIEALRNAADKLERARMSSNSYEVRQALCEVRETCRAISVTIDEQLDPSPVERVMRHLAFGR
jgi:hypothetical protein